MVFFISQVPTRGTDTRGSAFDTSWDVGSGSSVWVDGSLDGSMMSAGGGSDGLHRNSFLVTTGETHSQ